MKNEYEVRGDITAIVLPVPGGLTVETIIDTSDLKRADDFPALWRADVGPRTRNLYVRGDCWIDRRKHRVSLHRWLLPDVTARYIDHVDINPLNNRRSNLRPATPVLNSLNRGIQHNNTSGVPGVYWVASDQRWHSRVTLNGKRIHAGRFTNFEDAVAARKQVFDAALAVAVEESVTA